MAQFDVYRNPNQLTRARVPFLLDVQADLLGQLATRVVVPLCVSTAFEHPGAERVNPAFEVEGQKLLMLTPDLASVPRKILGDLVGNLSRERLAIISALDLVFTGV